MTSWPTSGVPSRSSRRRSASAASGAVGRDDPAVRRRRRPGRAASRAAVADRRRASATPTAGWAASHGSRSAIRSAPRTSMRPGSTIAAARAVGRSSAGSNGRRLGARRRVGRPRPAAVAAPATASKSSRSWSSPPGGPRRGVAPAGPQPSGRPATRAAGHVAALDDGPEPLGALLGGLAGHRRQALDERPELVLAEQPDDRVAVVVAEAGRLEVDLDRQVADDRRQLVAHRGSGRRARAACRRAWPGVTSSSRASSESRSPNSRISLAAVFSPTPGHARDVVGRVALERLVVDHLVGPQAEALVDPARRRT